MTGERPVLATEVRNQLVSKGNPVAEVVADVTFAGDCVAQVPCAVSNEDHVAAVAAQS